MPGTGAPGADPYGTQPPAGGQPPVGGQPPYNGQPPYGSGGPAPQQPGQVPGGEGQNRLLVGLLGIFLGGFGVHRFLLGYTTIGIIQIVVTLITCGAGALWGLIEGIMVLAKAPAFEKDAHGRPLQDL